METIAIIWFNADIFVVLVFITFFIYICNRLRKSKTLEHNKKIFLYFFYIRKIKLKKQEIYNYGYSF
jgi:hypothetical protein